MSNLLKIVNRDSYVVLETKLGWNTIWKKMVVKHRAPGYILLENNQKFNLQGKEIGTATPDYIYHPFELDENGRKYIDMLN